MRARPRLARVVVPSLALAALLAPVRTAMAQPGGSGLKAPEAPPADDGKKPKLTPPVLQKFVEAEYPPEAMKAGIEANVVLSLDIDATGKVIGVSVINPAGRGFDEAATEAVKKFVFEPALRDGKPIPSRITYRYAFTLKEAPAPGDAGKPAEKKVTSVLRGRVDVGSTGVPLAGARVVVKGAGGFSSELTVAEDGTWRVNDLPAGKYTVTSSAPGYEPLSVEEEVETGKVTEVLYRLSVAGGENEVVVRGERPPREVTKRTLEQRELSRIPGTNGDALRAIQNLPGVARPPGLAGFLIVRGSAPQDTQVFIDGALVPLAYHFGGLSSVIPTEMIERLDFYPGNFSAQYGRVMGGIVDVGVRSANKDGKFHGLAQADFIDARLLAEGPLGKGWSFIAGARRSYVDVWLKPALESAGAGVTTAPVYYDYQAFVEKEITPKSRFRVGMYGSDDRLEILIRSPASAGSAVVGGNVGFHTGFWRAQAVYTNELADDLRLRAMLSYGRDTVEFSLGSLYFNLYTQQIANRLELSHRITKGVTLNVGQDILWIPYDIDLRAPPPPRPGEPDPGPFNTRPARLLQTSDAIYRPGAFAELELTPTDRARVVAGFRADYAKDTGRWDASPRVNGRYTVRNEYPKTTVKGGVGVFHQAPNPQETSKVFGTPGILSNRAIHYSAGVEQELTKQIDVSVEGFYKQLDGLVSRKPTADGSFEYGNDGDGYVVGSEMLLRYKPDSRFFGWVAYTLSRSARRLNKNQELTLFQYDQTHIVTTLGSYRLGRGWEFGVRFRLISGPLITPCNSGIFSSASGAYVCVPGQTYSERLPMFHQLDLRLDKQWVYDAGWRLSTYLDILNVYNRRSPEGVAYNYNYTQSTYQSGLPFIPSVGVRAEF